MSRPDLLEALREATPPAPPSLREHVRELALAAAPPPRRLRRPRLRLAFAGVAIAAVAAAVAAALLVPGSQPSRPVAAPAPLHVGSSATLAPAIPGAEHVPSAAAGAPRAQFSAGLAANAVALPPPSSTRAQRYSASLRLRLATGVAVARAARRAVEIAQALGGHTQSFDDKVTAASGSATVVVRVPRARVTTAVDRLSALGAILAERVSISDLQAGIDETSVRIVRLERELAHAINAQPQTPQEQKLARALTNQILGLQRARATTLGAAADATVALQLTTPVKAHRLPPKKRPAHHGPFHSLVVAFRAVGIGAVYALALGTPLLALLLALTWLGARLRRRREERLLSGS